MDDEHQCFTEYDHTCPHCKRVMNTSSTSPAPNVGDIIKCMHCAGRAKIIYAKVVYETILIPTKPPRQKNTDWINVNYQKKGAQYLECNRCKAQEPVPMPISARQLFSIGERFTREHCNCTTKKCKECNNTLRIAGYITDKHIEVLYCKICRWRGTA